MGRSQKTGARTTILVDRATAPLIKNHSILMEGHAQFVTLQSPDNVTLTIVNIYALRSSLTLTIVHALPSHGVKPQERVSQSQVAELELGSTLPTPNSRKG
jgi:hypothetical protein